MDDLVNSAERLNGSLQLPVMVIIEPLTLTRTCILNILRRELTGFDIIEMATTDSLGCASGRDVRLVALSIGDRPIIHPSVESDLSLLVDCCPNASVALLSNRDDEATALAAMQRGVRGFFPTSIPVEVAVAGLRSNLVSLHVRQHAEGPTSGLILAKAAVGVARPPPAPAAGGEELL